MTLISLSLILTAALLVALPLPIIAFSASSSSPRNKLLYGIPNSGWTSPDWNWGSPFGTGHDCAAICRERYGNRKSRTELVQKLINYNGNGGNYDDNDDDDLSFEEIKLVLGLAWQNGRWDGSDGGPNGGYGDVLKYMAGAERYEAENGDDDEEDDECSKRFIADVQKRFPLLNPSDEALEAMNQNYVCSVTERKETDGNYFAPRCSRFRCSGLVLEAMKFAEKGL